MVTMMNLSRPRFRIRMIMNLLRPQFRIRTLMIVTALVAFALVAWFAGEWLHDHNAWIFAGPFTIRF